jgi:rare lipoprotein A
MRSSIELLVFAAALSGCTGSDYRPVSGRPTYDDQRPQPPATPSRDSAVDSGPLRPPETAEAPAYDAVGRATVTQGGADAVAALHATLPVGSAAEVTGLETGRTILVRIDGPTDSIGEIALRPAAAALLGNPDGAVVRVRAAVANPADAAALAAGRAASPRMDAPPALLAALRRRASPQPATAPNRAAAATRVAAPRPSTPGVRAIPGRFRVQVAAVSSEARARQIAGALGGLVEPAGRLWRVRLGPFADPAAARQARDGAARRGYADAQVLP